MPGHSLSESVKTTNFAHPPELSPNLGHGHHWFGNAESYFLIGDAPGVGVRKHGKSISSMYSGNGHAPGTRDGGLCPKLCGGGGPKTPVPAATGHAEAIFQPFRLDLTSLGQVHPGSSVLG